MKIMIESIDDFFDDRDKYNNRPGVCEIGGGDIDIREYYSIGHPSCIIHQPQYFFKDGYDNEYVFTVEQCIDEKTMWDRFDKMVKNKDINCNVREILIQKHEEREAREKRREKILKHVTPFFLKDKQEFLTQSFSVILYEFVCYWYGYTGCLGIVVQSITMEYINLFLEKIRSKKIDYILEKFEKQIRAGSGVVEISS